MTTIRYFIPEDGDSETYPNVFLAPRSRQSNAPPILNEIKQAFPLPGKYHFRFKSPLVSGGDSYGGKGSNVAVWMDCTVDSAPVPVWRNSIIAKVTRTGVEEEDDDDDEDFPREETHQNGGYFNDVPETQSSHSGAGASQTHSASPAPPEENFFEVFDGPGPEPSPASQHSSNHSSRNTSEADLFGMEPTPVAAPPSSNGSNTEASLLDMNTHHPASPHADNHDFFGGGAHTTPAPAPSPHDDLLKMRYTPQASAPAPPPQQPMQQRVAPPVQQQMHNPQQQQQQMHQQQQHAMGGYPNNNANAYNNYGRQQQQPGPFGGLSWNPQQQQQQNRGNPNQQQNRGRY